MLFNISKNSKSFQEEWTTRKKYHIIIIIYYFLHILHLMAVYVTETTASAVIINTDMNRSAVFLPMVRSW